MNRRRRTRRARAGHTARESKSAPSSRRILCQACPSRRSVVARDPVPGATELFVAALDGVVRTCLEHTRVGARLRQALGGRGVDAEDDAALVDLGYLRRVDEAVATGQHARVKHYAVEDVVVGNREDMLDLAEPLAVAGVDDRTGPQGEIGAWRAEILHPRSISVPRARPLAGYARNGQLVDQGGTRWQSGCGSCSTAARRSSTRRSTPRWG